MSEFYDTCVAYMNGDTDAKQLYSVASQAVIEIDALTADRDRLREELVIAIKALEFYGSNEVGPMFGVPESFEMDQGNRARMALEAIKARRDE